MDSVAQMIGDQKRCRVDLQGSSRIPFDPASHKPLGAYQDIWELHFHHFCCLDHYISPLVAYNSKIICTPGHEACVNMNSQQPHDDPLCCKLHLCTPFYLLLLILHLDWVLLTDSLQFCYTSPSFNAVVPNSKYLIGRPFFDYLSPEDNPPVESISQRLLNCYSDELGNGDVSYTVALSLCTN
jgi:hypothetical protein